MRALTVTQPWAGLLAAGLKPDENRKRPMIKYMLRDVRALPEPVPCSGAQPFWHVPPDIEARVAAQMARAA